MSRLGPVITLAAGAVLAAGLGVASMNATPAANTAAANTPSEPAPATPAAAPAAPTPTAKQTVDKADYAGYVKGDGGLIAISVRDGKAVGYFCDGRTEAWLKGGAAAGKATLKGFGGATASATLGGGQARGWLALGGKKWTFTAGTVRKPSGLYRATAQVRGAKIRAGWIVLKRPQGGFYQVGAAYEDDRQLRIPELDGDRPTNPVALDQATLYPKDVDGFIQEIQ
ncbi:hypothetical protein ABT294_37680 [Nonomuraea sp. NPDC000554]|uniref:hypothetical protein n=1 Tax=Nonomuraea sp. NPDC000554 TaxID=3154259 RepID=UPI0033339BC8